MANKNIFKSASRGKAAPAADTVNNAGGKAYQLGEKAALAQYAATGTFNDTFYTKGTDQVDDVLALLPKIDVPFIAKVAVYSREQGRMKDMPALLAAHLANRGHEGRAYLKLIFPFVIDNGKMLRNFVQIIRSGKTGRKSFGTAIKRLARRWFDSKQPQDIFKMSVGNDPSLGNIVRMVRPLDLGSPERKAFYAYLFDKEHDFESLPPLVKEYEKFKKDPSTWEGELPRVPFEMLQGLPLSDKQWRDFGLNMSWTQLRLNLNTLARHGVFKNESVTKQLADKLANAELIEKAKPFPYQIFTAYLHTETTGEEAVPQKMKNALHTALELSTKNVPIVQGNTYVGVDVSGSMSSAVTGSRKGATSKARCIDVAALIACTFLRQNKDAEIIPFDTGLHKNHGLEPHDAIMTNAAKLAKFGGGGTDCHLVLADLNKRKAKGDLVVYVSDNESWVDSIGGYGRRGATSTAVEWQAYKARNPKAKLVCIDLAAADTVQVKSDMDALNIGGFSDTIWEVIKSFVEGTPSADHWVSVIEATKLPEEV